MDIYIKRYDGCAATTEDFIASIIQGAIPQSSSSSFDSEKFYEWYYQSGTPHVSIRR